MMDVDGYDKTNIFKSIKRLEKNTLIRLTKIPNNIKLLFKTCKYKHCVTHKCF